MDINEEEIRRRNKDTHLNSARYWVGLANQQSFEINKQFLTFAALLLTLSTSAIALVNANSSSNQLTDVDKVLLLASWVFLILSLISGIIQIVVDVKFFIYLCVDESKRERIWSQMGKSNETLNEEEQALGSTDKSSTFIPLILQGVFLTLAIVFLMTLGVTLLY